MLRTVCRLLSLFLLIVSPCPRIVYGLDFARANTHTGITTKQDGLLNNAPQSGGDSVDAFVRANKGQVLGSFRVFEPPFLPASSPPLTQAFREVLTRDCNESEGQLGAGLQKTPFGHSMALPTDALS